MKRYRVTVSAYAIEIAEPGAELEDHEHELFLIELEAESAAAAALVASRLPKDPGADMAKALEEHAPAIQAMGAKLGEAMAEKIADHIVGRLGKARPRRYPKPHEPKPPAGGDDGR